MHVVCKQAIFTAKGELAFYEVFLQDRATGKYPKDMDPLKATSMVIDVLTEVGPKKVGGGKLVFVNVPAIFLEASMFDLLSSQYVGIELVENRRLNNNTVEAIKELTRRGFKFCIDDFGFEKIDYLPLLSKCHFVKIDLKNNPYDEEELAEVVRLLKELKKGTIVKNIETQEDYEKAIKLGFDYMQGIFLSKPYLVKDTRTMSYLKSTILRIYEAIKAGDMNKVADVIERDVGVAYKLLKFINTAYFPKLREINNIQEVVAYLGLDNVAKFTIVLALSEMFAEEEEINLWKKALFRASLAERIAEVYAEDSKDKAYLVGLFSLAPEILGENPVDVAKSLYLDKEIIQAYESRLTPLGFVLSLVELLEDDRHEKTLEKVARIIGVSVERLKEMINEAEEDANRLVSQSVA